MNDSFMDIPDLSGTSQSGGSAVRFVPDSQMSVYAMADQFKPEDVVQWDMLAMMTTQDSNIDESMVLVNDRMRRENMDDIVMDAPDDISEIDDEERPDDYEVEDPELDFYLEADEMLYDDVMAVPLNDDWLNDIGPVQYVDPKQIFSVEGAASVPFESPMEPNRSAFATVLSEYSDNSYSASPESLFDFDRSGSVSSDDSDIVSEHEHHHDDVDPVIVDDNGNDIDMNRRSSSFSRARQPIVAVPTVEPKVHNEEVSRQKLKAKPKSKRFSPMTATQGTFRCEWTVENKQCGRTFTRPYDLTRHHETVHSSDKKTFYCDICPAKSFSRLDALTRHMKTKHNL